MDEIHTCSIRGVNNRTPNPDLSNRWRGGAGRGGAGRSETKRGETAAARRGTEARRGGAAGRGEARRGVEAGWRGGVARRGARQQTAMELHSSNNELMNTPPNDRNGFAHSKIYIFLFK